MKLFFLDFKMDSELNSVSQNSPVFTPRCKFSFEPLLVRVTDPPSNQTVIQLFPLCPLFSTTPLHLSPYRAACPQALFSWILLGLTAAESCKLHFQQELLLTAVTRGPASIPDQLAPAAATQSLPADFTIWGPQSKLAPSRYPCKGKSEC